MSSFYIVGWGIGSAYIVSRQGARDEADPVHDAVDRREFVNIDGTLMHLASNTQPGGCRKLFKRYAMVQTRVDTSPIRAIRVGTAFYMSERAQRQRLVQRAEVIPQDAPSNLRTTIRVVPGFSLLFVLRT